MKKLFEEDNEYSDLDKRKIIVTVIPFALIVVILAVTLLVNNIKKDKDVSSKLQQNIMEYADENREEVLKTEESIVSENEIVAENPDAEADKPDTQPEEENTVAPSPNKEVMEQADYSKVKFDKEEQLKEMMGYWAGNNQKALDDLANLERFIAMSWTLRESGKFYYYGDVDSSGQPDGKGIAVYADNQYYYGDWKNGVRSGTGTWIHYHIHQAKNTSDLYVYHQYTGGWANDLPEGEGSEHYDYNEELLKAGIRYDTNLIGSYSKGLVNGDFYITSIDSNGEYEEWNARAEHGSWLYQSENKDKQGNRPVYVNLENPDNYIWMQPKDNQNIGVRCLLSKNKN